jgi:sortase A
MSGGALFIYFGGRDLIESHLGQEEAQRQFQVDPAAKPSPFHASLRGGMAGAFPDGAPEPGDAIARLTIPRLQSDLYVVEGDGARQLRRGPGHVSGTAMPGQDGNCIIAGHRDTHFRVLKDIRAGDEIILQTRDGEYRYRVETTQIVSPRDTKSLRRTADAQLHLVTCYPFYYLGSAPQRFIVQAALEAGRTPETLLDKPVKPALAAAHSAGPGEPRSSSRKMN